MVDRWLEVNIFLTDYAHANDVLRDTIARLVQSFRDEELIKAWHFFREPQIRLRFFCDEEDITEIRDTLDRELANLEAGRPDFYVRHTFGSHGQEGIEYTGEAGFWLEDWPLVMKLWEDMSDFSLGLISKGFSKIAEIHGERQVHLLLNELGVNHIYVDTGTEKIIQLRRTKAPGE